MQIIALKDGARGCTVAVPGQAALSLPPWPCHCVEPVGAGDAFNAGFLAGVAARPVPRNLRPDGRHRRGHGYRDPR